ncbi:MAG: alanine--tRNA ligase [Bacteroidales bacterium]|nr:alanine--tRNA ligase [Bacteroidales bacterium]
MTSLEIRQTFLDFFRSKQHLILPSASIVVKNDPTLMFTNAGMNQFKEIFLGNTPPKALRVANTQKCLRVSGKHNDLEEVGYDTYHHTMFEMLGNWSFGDYFKKEAIEWAWELLTQVYKIEQDRLYVTVFGGDSSDGLEPDQEAYDHWKTIVAADRILYGDKKDNFWEMGDTGPCGPCSEIHVDLRDESERNTLAGSELVNQDHPLVIEIWNLVFIEYNRQAGGSLVKLPAKHVDTGMGFERLAMALQHKRSNYDTDIFQPLIQAVAKMSGSTYGVDEQKDIAMRVIADHVRAVAFTIADGQLPSNTGGGYVIRRILRRAIRYGYTFLKFDEPFVYRLLPILTQQLAEVFPELESQQELISKLVFEEETSFLRTLAHGIRKFENYIDAHPEATRIQGDIAFELFDTYGFPVDLTNLLAREKGLEVDMPGFQQRLNEQKERSRKAAATAAGDWVILHQSTQPTLFVGYNQLEITANVVRYREVVSKKRTHYEIVLDQTPFYAEAGGQLGDTGLLINEDEQIEVFNTVKENNLIIHLTSDLPMHPEKQFIAQVDKGKRLTTANNHSATHLMHAALRQVLGTHVEQKGSMVGPERLRFDFSHYSKLTADEIRRIEKMVNAKIRENISAHIELHVPIEEARAKGAIALFGEKYDEFVRVISFDPEYSIELCGGTHVKTTGSIGSFRIISEGAIAAGIRRIEAVTGEKAEEYANQFIGQIHQIRALIKGSGDIVKAVQQQLEQQHLLQKKVESLQQEIGMITARQLMQHAEPVQDFFLIQHHTTGDMEVVRQIASQIRQLSEDYAAIIYSSQDNKAIIGVSLGSRLADTKNLDAAALIKEVSKEIQGGGGGNKYLATAGGKNPNGLQRALEIMISKIKKA